MSQELVDLLVKFDVPVPRYTSYPTAPEWKELDESVYDQKLALLGGQDVPIALYFHIPFCQTMCLFCACSVVLNRRPENEERYVDYLCREIDLVGERLKVKKRVRQLHFGGGTPTKLSLPLLERLFTKIKSAFIFEEDAELAIEIDPRTVFQDQGEKLESLFKWGFNRVSFGVQDTNAEVQEAIRRRQSFDVTCYTYEKARDLGFAGINIDLIYGLPKQTYKTFCETIDNILLLRPDRLALFSYAKVPWMKQHQKAIPDALLPKTDEKFAMYAMARERLIEAGYAAIGMDHFALQGDEMARAHVEKKLQRNFQGYTVLDVNDLISFGITAIGFFQGLYVQNVKELSHYYERLDAGRLAVCKGKELGTDDLIRRWVIQRLMCDFEVNKVQFEEKFGLSFNEYFASERQALVPFIEQKLVTEDECAIRATEMGELFIRNITASFDWYLAQKTAHKHFSKAI